MALKEQPKLTTWSYSAWKEWKQCPFKSFLKRIKGLKEPSGPQAERGTQIHQLAQDHTEGKLRCLPKELETFRAEFTTLRKMEAMCELEWGFTSTWEPCDFKAPNVWLRVKTDAIYSPSAGELVVVDHKTGKIYAEDHALQVELYALAAFLLHPTAEHVKTVLWYLDQNHREPADFVREDVPRLKQVWEERVAPMLNDSIFPCRPGPLCRYCHFSRTKNGPCSF